MKLTCLLPFQTLTESGPLLHFAKEMLLHPREVGAVCPSSPRLAQAMADCIPDGEGLVAELGAGTGVVTEAILSRVPSSELVVLEQSADFCRILRDRYRNVRIIQGDAARLCSYIPQNVPIRAVVSSLPLMNFSGEQRERIFAQMRQAVGIHGRVIQFTYAFFFSSPFESAGFQREKSRIIPFNVPPAKVERFRYTASGNADAEEPLR